MHETKSPWAEKKLDKSTITVGDFKISWSVTGTTGRQCESARTWKMFSSLDFIEVTHFCSAEDILQRMKRQVEVRKKTVTAIT